MAPLGREVCLEVLDHLRGLCGVAQPVAKKDGQITCEVLYDSAAAKAPRPEPRARRIKGIRLALHLLR